MPESPKNPDKEYPNWRTDNEVFERMWQDLLKIQKEAHSKQKGVLEVPLEDLTVID